MITYKNTYIHDLEFYVPEKRITNQELIDTYKIRMKADWIQNRIGITTRAWAADQEAASDLALKAIRKMKNPLEGSIFLSTISQDYLTPSTSSELKRKLGWTQSLSALDLSASCAGFIFATEMAASRLHLIPDEFTYAVATEVRSRYLNKTDRRTAFLFGDGAAAMKLSTSSKASKGELLWTSCYTLSKGEAEILIPAGGSKYPITSERVANGEQFITMVDGVAIEETIYEFLLQKVKDSLSLRKEKIEDYSFVVFHQGNATLIQNLMQQMGLPLDRTHINFDVYGNSSSASVGVALAEAVALKKIKSGSKVLAVAMGAGYNLGMMGLTWNV
jgi:3-oxoacyl-[acyl-carrier-protein] synthase-3